MLKKMISALLALAILAFVPVMLIGCEQNEAKVTTKSESKRVVSQETKVE